MTISGPEALRSLEEALRDIRREEDEISRRLARSTELVSRIRETEGDLFRQLASVRLDPQVREELSAALGRAEQRAREMLKGHAAELADAEARVQAAESAITTLNAERGRATARLAAETARLDALGTAISADLASDPDYRARRTDAEELARIAAESFRKTETAEADREEKGRPYREDPLFIYLWERGYGTSAYKAGNLTRLLDGWVARLVRFERARPNYAMLNEIPLRLREHAERQQQRAEEAREACAALEAAAIDRAGGAPIRKAMAEAGAEITRIDAALIEREDERDAAAETHAELAKGEDDAFTQAVEALSEGLRREDLRTLLAEARRTQTPQDDTIVAQIDDVRLRAADEELEMREHKERLKTLTRRRRELEDIQFEFKKSRYDDPRSSFGEDKLVGDMLNEFLRGGMTAARYWDAWRKSQNWKSGGAGGTPWPKQGGGFQWPDSAIGGGSGRSRGGFGGAWGAPGGTSQGGGGFSRPRTGSKGSRKGGGFKTGGGF
ncbi:hypothetical protein EMQ25_15365 [Arsenicitalea aurantiaca]|uniref:Uncharacterized protein n=1 Tax=Arsenicitalea aurantiaca TaxID=1783274 RepID=A0A433X3X9_9HYPH|nr:hypothetical protein [Arsenicitalea aurantiaca]RUT28768.1 hypothetical protein EMQ25_15365 [Arsenicitalea aurantiaca]